MRDEVSWLDDVRVLFREEALYRISFFECDNKEYTERFNELARFVIWYAIILSVYKRDTIYIVFTLIIGALAMFLNRVAIIEKMETSQFNTADDPVQQLVVKPEPIKNECLVVTESNPFGNPSIGFKTSQPTCKDQFKKSEEFFFKDLPLDPLDPFRRQSQQRQFHTLPVTTDINAQSEYANWLYN
jgi:hypothetical protein